MQAVGYLHQKGVYLCWLTGGGTRRHIYNLYQPKAGTFGVKITLTRRCVIVEKLGSKGTPIAHYTVSLQAFKAIPITCHPGMREMINSFLGSEVICPQKTISPLTAEVEKLFTVAAKENIYQAGRVLRS